MKNINKLKIFLFVMVTVVFASCTKLVKVPGPVTRINSETVYKDDVTAIAVVNGIYIESNRALKDYATVAGLSLNCALSADELNLIQGSNQPSRLNIYQNTLSNQNNQNYWASLYGLIYRTNAVIEGVTISETLTPKVKQQLLGEAKFNRALFYFYLVNLYGDAALALTTDYVENSKLSRAPKDQVYAQIIEDLKDAKTKLSDDFLDGTLLNPVAQKVRPTKWAAIALLARAYLYTADWENAEIESSLLINNPLFSLTALNGVFLSNSNESIWQWQAAGWGGNNNSESAIVFILPPTGISDSYPVWLSQHLLNAFETGDLRRKDWIDSVIVNGNVFYYPYKYKIRTPDAAETEQETLFRLGEQYLIRAEARANRAGMIASGIDDLNVIRNRAGLDDYSGNTDKESVLTAILKERQVELFTEWGHRWLDLKRTGMVDAVMTTVTTEKGGTWQPFQALYPLPLDEIQKNAFLSQNPGY